MGILMMGGQPIIILKEGTEREKGKGAVTNNIAAARAVADAVKSTLGPKGMDKMLVDSLGDVTITNDGVTILKEIEIEHPTAKMLVEVAKTRHDERRDPGRGAPQGGREPDRAGGPPDADCEWLPDGRRGGR